MRPKPNRPSSWKVEVSTLEEWCRLWIWATDLDTIDIVVNRRLKKTLARGLPRQRRIEVGQNLRRRRLELQLEIAAHELAHLAIHELYGPSTKPHGPEWAGLMRAAGFEPRGVIGSCRGSDRAEVVRRPADVRYEHRCPVCQFVRWARRPVQRWRCRSCLEAGLDGRLVVSLLARPRKALDA